jgi:type II secretory pathway pseudopilin PulG
MKRLHGFTLIEVLVAALIMFTVLSLSALGVQTFRLSSYKSDKLIKALTPVRAIVLQIKQDLQQRPVDSVESTGLMQGVSYRWHATLLEHKAAPIQMDPDTGLLSSSVARFKLYQIELSLSYEGYSTTKLYKEVIW